MSFVGEPPGLRQDPEAGAVGILDVSPRKSKRKMKIAALLGTMAAVGAVVGIISTLGGSGEKEESFSTNSENSITSFAAGIEVLELCPQPLCTGGASVFNGINVVVLPMDGVDTQVWNVTPEETSGDMFMATPVFFSLMPTSSGNGWELQLTLNYGFDTNVHRLRSLVVNLSQDQSQIQGQRQFDTIDSLRFNCFQDAHVTPLTGIEREFLLDPVKFASEAKRVLDGQVEVGIVNPGLKIRKPSSSVSLPLQQKVETQDGCYSYDFEALSQGEVSARPNNAQPKEVCADAHEEDLAKPLCKALLGMYDPSSALSAVCRANVLLHDRCPCLCTVALGNHTTIQDTLEATLPEGKPINTLTGADEDMGWLSSLQPLPDLTAPPFQDVPATESDLDTNCTKPGFRCCFQHPSKEDIVCMEGEEQGWGSEMCPENPLNITEICLDETQYGETVSNDPQLRELRQLMNDASTFDWELFEQQVRKNIAELEANQAHGRNLNSKCHKRPDVCPNKKLSDKLKCLEERQEFFNRQGYPVWYATSEELQRWNVNVKGQSLADVDDPNGSLVQKTIRRVLAMQKMDTPVDAIGYWDEVLTLQLDPSKPIAGIDPTTQRLYNQLNLLSERMSGLIDLSVLVYDSMLCALTALTFNGWLNPVWPYIERIANVVYVALRPFSGAPLGIGVIVKGIMVVIKGVRDGAAAVRRGSDKLLSDNIQCQLELIYDKLGNFAAKMVGVRAVVEWFMKPFLRLSAKCNNMQQFSQCILDNQRGALETVNAALGALDVIQPAVQAAKTALEGIPCGLLSIFLRALGALKITIRDVFERIQTFVDNLETVLKFKYCVNIAWLCNWRLCTKVVCFSMWDFLRGLGYVLEAFYFIFEQTLGRLLDKVKEWAIKASEAVLGPVISDMIELGEEVAKFAVPALSFIADKVVPFLCDIPGISDLTPDNTDGMAFFDNLSNMLDTLDLENLPFKTNTPSGGAATVGCGFFKCFEDHGPNLCSSYYDLLCPHETLPICSRHGLRKGTFISNGVTWEANGFGHYCVYNAYPGHAAACGKTSPSTEFSQIPSGLISDGFCGTCGVTARVGARLVHSLDVSGKYCRFKDTAHMASCGTTQTITLPSLPAKWKDTGLCACSDSTSIASPLAKRTPYLDKRDGSIVELTETDELCSYSDLSSYKTCHGATLPATSLTMLDSPPSSEKPGRGQQYDTVTFSENFRIEFDVELDATNAAWTNLLHVGEDNAVRPMSVFVRPGSRQLHTCVASTTTGSTCCDGGDLLVGASSHVVVRSVRGLVNVLVDGKQGCTISLPGGKARGATSLPLYISSPHYEAAAARIRKVTVRDEPSMSNQVIVPSRGKKFLDSVTLTENFHIHFNLYLRQAAPDGQWTNLLHTSEGDYPRYASIYFAPGGAIAFFCVASLNDQNDCCRANQQFPLNTWQFVKMQVWNGQLSATIDDRVVCSKQLSGGRATGAVHQPVYVSGNYNTPASAVIRDLVVENIHTSSTPPSTLLPRRGVEVQVLSLSRNFEVAFDLEVIGVRREWTNVVHIGETDAKRPFSVFVQPWEITHPFSAKLQFCVASVNSPTWCSSGCSPSTRLSLGKPHRVVAKVLGSSFRVFFDGVQVCATTLGGGAVGASSEPLFLSNEYVAPADVRLRDLHITDSQRPFSSVTVQAATIHNRGTCATCTGTVLDASTGTYAYVVDSSGAYCYFLDAKHRAECYNPSGKTIDSIPRSWTNLGPCACGLFGKIIDTLDSGTYRDMTNGLTFKVYEGRRYCTYPNTQHLSACGSPLLTPIGFADLRNYVNDGPCVCPGVYKVDDHVFRVASGGEFCTITKFHSDLCQVPASIPLPARPGGVVDTGPCDSCSRVYYSGTTWYRYGSDGTVCSYDPAFNHAHYRACGGPQMGRLPTRPSGYEDIGQCDACKMIPFDYWGEWKNRCTYEIGNHNPKDTPTASFKPGANPPWTRLQLSQDVNDNDRFFFRQLCDIHWLAYADRPNNAYHETWLVEPETINVLKSGLGKYSPGGVCLAGGWSDKNRDMTDLGDTCVDGWYAGIYTKGDVDDNDSFFFSMYLKESALHPKLQEFMETCFFHVRYSDVNGNQSRCQGQISLKGVQDKYCRTWGSRCECVETHGKKFIRIKTAGDVDENDRFYFKLVCGDSSFPDVTKDW